MPNSFSRLISSERGRDAGLAAALLAGLVAVYLFTYQGTLRSGDESFLAAGAQSLGRLGSVQIGAVFGDRPSGQFDVERGQAVVGALIDAGARAAGVGSLHALFLLNVYATALTAVAVFGLVRQQGFGPGVALSAGLVYGLATMAWPNTKFFFRDPLAVAWALGGVWLCEGAGARRTLAAQVLQWTLGLGLLAVGVATKQTVAFVAVAVLLAAAARAWVGGPERRPAVAGLALIAIVAGLSLLVPPEGQFSRLSAWHYLRLAAEFTGQAGSSPWGEILAGLLISPGKGLFVEAPILLLALAAVPISLRRGVWPRLVTPWAALVMLVLAVPAYRDNLWWGGVGWGVRHLLPVVPLLVVASAPALQALGAAGRRWAWAAGGVLLGASALIQVGAVTGSLEDYYARLNAAAPGAPWSLAIWDFRYSELIGYWQGVVAGQPWAFAWVRLLTVRPAWSAGMVAGGFVCLALLAAGAGARCLRAPSARAVWAGVALAVAAVSVVPYAFLRWLYPDPDYVAWRDDFRAAAEVVAQRAHPEDVVLVRGYLHPLWKYTLNYAAWPAPWYAFSPVLPTEAEAAAWRAARSPENAVAPEVQALVTEQLLGQHARLWLVNDRGAPAGDLRLEAWWLAERVVPVTTIGNVTQVSQFELVTPQAGDWQPARLAFGPALRLEAWGLLPAGRTRYQPGEVVAVALRWQALAALPADYTIGLYLLDAGGALVAQRDSQPVDGFRPTSGWAPGETVQDLHGLALPEDLPPGAYRLSLAVYDGQTLQRLPASAGADGLVFLSPIEVANP